MYKPDDFPILRYVKTSFIRGKKGGREEEEKNAETQ